MQGWWVEPSRRAGEGGTSHPPLHLPQFFPGGPSVHSHLPTWPPRPNPLPDEAAGWGAGAGLVRSEAGGRETVSLHTCRFFPNQDNRSRHHHRALTSFLSSPCGCFLEVGFLGVPSELSSVNLNRVTLCTAHVHRAKR